MLKFAQENNLTESDLNYLLEQGLEKIASDLQEEELVDAFEKVASAYDVTPEVLDMLIQEGYEKVANTPLALPYTPRYQHAAKKVLDFAKTPKGKGVGMGVGALGALGATAYGINKAKKKEVEKQASAGFTNEEIEYIIAQGLEKVASDLELEL